MGHVEEVYLNTVNPAQPPLRPIVTITTNEVTCPYCRSPAQLVGGDTVYPHLPYLSAKKFWHCARDAAWVGCHEGTERPFGTLANAELRTARMAAHAAFDPIWQSGEVRRVAAYWWLALKLRIDIQGCHIGQFDLETCQHVIKICKDYNYEQEQLNERSQTETSQQG